MQRPTTPALLLAFISAALVPAVGTIQAGALAAQDQARKDADKAAADKATADAASAKAIADKAAADTASQQAAEEMNQAQAEQEAAAQKAAQAAQVQDQLNTVQVLLGVIPKLPDADGQAVFGIVNKQLDGLMSGLDLSFETPPAALEASAASA